MHYLAFFLLKVNTPGTFLKLSQHLFYHWLKILTLRFWYFNQ